MNMFNIKYFEQNPDGTYRQHIKHLDQERQDMPTNFTLFNQQNLKQVEFVLELVEIKNNLEVYKYVTRFVDIPERNLVVYLEKDLD